MRLPNGGRTNTVSESALKFDFGRTFPCCIGDTNPVSVAGLAFQSEFLPTKLSSPLSSLVQSLQAFHSSLKTRIPKVVLVFSHFILLYHVFLFVHVTSPRADMFANGFNPFPSLPQAEKSARLKDTLMRLKNNIFSGPITNLLSMLCFDENLFILQRKREQRGLKVSNFAPSHSVVIFK